MSPIPKFARTAWDEAKKSPKEVNASLAFYRFFEPVEKEPQTKPPLDYMMTLDLQDQCAHLLDRQAKQVATLRAQGWEADHWVQVTQSRLACGLGIPHSSENGLLLDRISGAPYLAGTGLKGLALDMALEELEDIREEEREQAENIKRAVFGCDAAASPDGSSYKGCVHFFDAFPDVRSPRGKHPFQTDIVNPHYGKYYGSGGGTPPADYLAPVPSFFLTVRREVPFGFALAARSSMGAGEEGMNFEARELLETARCWLQTALVQLGAGGKTRVGYGIFRSPAAKEGSK